MGFTRIFSEKILKKSFGGFLRQKFLKATSFFLFFYGTFFRSQMGYSCKFSPTCSLYAKESFQTHGLIKGFFYSIRRILRCHPFSSGGFDPVPKKGVSFNE